MRTTHLRRLALATVLCTGAAGAFAQSDCGADLKSAERAESARYVVVWRAQPAIAVSRHFALDIAVCAKAGAPAAETLAVDARMPEHGHGMNYKAAVKALGNGRFRAEGLMLHMPGRWEFEFAVGTGAAAERVRRDYLLR